jgi:ABC-type dipeptide/oligopeptide/nickel transport system ATPase subunit
MDELRYNIRIAADGRELVSIGDFRLVKSCVTVLFGESGIGKSLSALAIAGLLDPEQLDVQINRVPYEEYLKTGEVADLRKNGFFVFQEPSSHLNPLLTLRTQLQEGNLAGGQNDRPILERLWRGSPASGVQRILDVFPKPYRPSGGEKQRVLAAMAFKKMAMARNPDSGALFFFDEPTGNLDNELRNQFLDLLFENFVQYRMTILLITHDYSMISRFTKSYADVAKRIFYKELVLDRSRLRMRDFLPSEYLTWIGRKRPTEHAPNDSSLLLRLEPTVRIFGKTLRLSRKKGEGDSEPLCIRKGAISYLKAPSGTGKTTVIKLMMGLLKGETMTMELKGHVYTERTPRSEWSHRVWGRQMSMVFQHADEALNPNAKVKEVFDGLPLREKMNDAMIVRALSDFFEGIPEREFLMQPVKYLSGGQKQRLNLLRSIVLHTDILLLDEPLNGLDFASSVKVIGKLEEKLKLGIGILVVSHNEEIFETLVERENVYYLHAAE